MTSYQKLKAENEKLRDEIDVLVNRYDSKEGMTIRFSYKIKQDIEDTIYFGTRTPLDQDSPVKFFNKIKE